MIPGRTYPMGMAYKKAYTMPLPRGAAITKSNGKRVAQWRLRSGQLRSAEVITGQDGKLRVRGQSRYYTVRFRDGAGRTVEVATRCRDATAARAILAEHERRVELIRAGVITETEANVASYAYLPLSKHLNSYVQHLQAKRCAPRRIAMVRRRIERVAEDCHFSKLNKLSADSLERWLLRHAEAGMAPATLNGYRESMLGFANWCRRARRITHNPFTDVPRADQNVNRRHQRRARTTAEVARLLKVARLRPLAEHGRTVVRKDSSQQRQPRSRATWKRASLNIDNIDAAVDHAREVLKNKPELIDRLDRIGHERALIFKTLALTGLRKGELASLTTGQIDFSGPVTYAMLNAADEKNRKGSSIPIRADLAAELSAWLAERLRERQEHARRNGMPIPVCLPPSTPLFYVATGLTRIFDRDLAVAGIAKRDERNRVADVHALRTTFCTNLCAAGVPLPTAQAAMRHSKPELTVNIYTDPKLLDVAGAVNALPDLGLSSDTALTSAPPA